MSDKQNFESAKAWLLASTATFTPVADTTARDAISTPASGDYAYIKSDGGMDKYTGTWGDAPATDEYCFTSDNNAQTPDEFNVDDSCTGTYSEFVAGRAELTGSANRKLKDGSGDLVTGEAIAFTYNSLSPDITDLSATITIGEVESTSSGTSSTALKEFDPLKKDATFTVTTLKDGTAELVTGVAAAVTLTFAAGITLTGSAFLTKDKTRSLGETTKVTYNGRFTGDVTFTGITDDLGTTYKYVFKDNTLNIYYGDALYKTSKTFTANIAGDAITLDESWRLNDIPTEVLS